MPISIIVAIAVIVFIAAIVLTELEHWGFATLTLGVSVAALHYFNIVDVYTFLKTHLLTVGLYTLLYLATGVVWSFIKWFSYLYRFRDDLREAKEAHQEYIRTHTMPPEGEFTFSDYMDHRYELRHLRERPTAAKNKSRIIAWIALWPFSLVGTFLNDPVRRICNAIYNRFKSLYQRAADHVFRNDPELPN